MARVDELQKKYPDLPREVIVKFEVLSQGVTDSEVLDRVAVWDRAGSYQSRDLDVTMKDIAEKRLGTVRPGYVMRPDPFHMKNGIGVAIWRASRSRYEIRDAAEGQYALYEGEEKVEDIYFAGPRPRNEEDLTSYGTPVSSLVSGAGHCFRIQPVRHCEYFTYDEQCRFCNYNSTFEDARSIGLNPPITTNLEETVEAYKVVSAKVRLVEGRIQMGGFRSKEQEAKIHMNYLEKIAGGAPYTPHLIVSSQPMPRKNLQRLKDAGLASGNFNVEVWGAELFAEVCPGKAKHRGGFEGYLDSYLEAVEVLGAGRVCTNFVAGADLLARGGGWTWQDSRDSLTEGFRWLIENGVLPIFLPVRLGAGSVYGSDQSNWAKLPPTDYYLDLALAHHEAMLEHGLYERMSKLLVCPLDCQHFCYSGEIGMISLAGDLGNWAADCMPDDANWLARFISAVKEKA